MAPAGFRASHVSPLHALARTRACRAADAREAVSSDADADGCVCDESPDAEAPAVRKRVLALRGAMVLACAALSLAALLSRRARPASIYSARRPGTRPGTSARKPGEPGTAPGADEARGGSVGGRPHGSGPRAQRQKSPTHP